MQRIKSDPFGTSKYEKYHNYNGLRIISKIGKNKYTQYIIKNTVFQRKIYITRDIQMKQFCVSLGGMSVLVMLTGKEKIV